MQHDHFPDAEVEGWLKTVGVESLCQWDVLVFLYRHQTSLVGADYLAHLLGYATEPVLTALDVLESVGLVDRSRVSQGARLYQFTGLAGPPRHEAFERLLALADHRAGRLLLSKHLYRSDRPSPHGLSVTPVFGEQAKQAIQEARQQGQECQEGRKRWLKAI